jgi:hypothetical protein
MAAEIFTVHRSDACDGLPRDCSQRFKFRIPVHWRSPLARNPYAFEAERQVLSWLHDLGCTPAEVERARRFDVAGYVGIPFPYLSGEMTNRIGKYLSMWLLWDDLQIESLADRWRIDARHVLDGAPPDGMTRFDHGWWQLFREFAARRSGAWIEDLCASMSTWNDAAAREAVAMKDMRDHGIVPEFAMQVEMRIKTIGMYATVYLLEDAYGFELPRAFHEDPRVRKLKKLSNKIVGLGNDVFSCGKDLAEGHLNLVSTLIRGGEAGDDALEQVIRMHDQAIDEYDRLASSLRSWGREEDLFIERWLQDVRYASLGFSLWESQAPRYTAHKVVFNRVVIEPSFSFVAECSDYRPLHAHGG